MLKNGGIFHFLRFCFGFCENELNHAQSRAQSNRVSIFSATDCSGSDFEAGAGTGLSKSSLNSSSSAEKK